MTKYIANCNIIDRVYPLIQYLIINELNAIRKIFPTSASLAEAFAKELLTRIKHAEQKNEFFTLVLSGGSTPNLLFSILADHFAASVDWRFVHIFWGDERCVPPTDKESNYGMAHHILINKIDIPDKNIHRIKGELNPGREASRYSKELIEFTRSRNELPMFDLILLGLGEDGHIASIFPNNLNLFQSDNICEVAQHPVTSQKRITLTGQVINNAESIVFLVTGKTKAKVVSDILNKRKASADYPAFKVVPEYGIIEWFLDEDAAFLLK
jgi:6-phosphogluconolactonase